MQDCEALLLQPRQVCFDRNVHQTQHRAPSRNSKTRLYKGHRAGAPGNVFFFARAPILTASKSPALTRFTADLEQERAACCLPTGGACQQGEDFVGHVLGGGPPQASVPRGAAPLG
mmetsp:Transcript_81341/g.136141  ORF Transcript_81341/g.136141 Transcript_81341/m.136141 type:complete len:116 (+) Transcript_81341:915-1262(+)